MTFLADKKCHDYTSSSLSLPPTLLHVLIRIRKVENMNREQEYIQHDPESCFSFIEQGRREPDLGI